VYAVYGSDNLAALGPYRPDGLDLGTRACRITSFFFVSEQPRTLSYPNIKGCASAAKLRTLVRHTQQVYVVRATAGARDEPR